MEQPVYQDWKRSMGYGGDIPGWLDDILGQQYNKQFGKELSPDQRLTQEAKQYADKPVGNYLGQNYDYLTKYLKDILGSGLPNKANILQEGRGVIDTSVNNAVTQANEGLASRGLFRSGVGAAVEGNIRGQGSAAYGSLQNDINELEQQRKSNAIQNLLGLNQFEGSQNLNEKQMNLGYSEFQQRLAEAMRQFQQKMDNQPSDFARILASILSAGATVGAAAIK